MDLKTLRAELQKLTALAEGWDVSHEMVDIERDLALAKLRDIYDAVRFGLTPAAESARTDDVPPADPVSVEIDLDAVMPLAAEAEVFAGAEVSAAVGAEVAAGPAVLPDEDPVVEPAVAAVTEEPAGEALAPEGAESSAGDFAEVSVAVDVPVEEPAPAEVPVEEVAPTGGLVEEPVSAEVAEEEFTLIEIPVEAPAAVGAEVAAGPAALPAEEPAVGTVTALPAGEASEVAAPEVREATAPSASVVPAEADAAVSEEVPVAADSSAAEGISLSLFEVAPVDTKRAKHRVVLSLYGDTEPAGAVGRGGAAAPAGPIATGPQAEPHAAPLSSPVLPFSAPEAAAPAVTTPAAAPAAVPVVPAAEPVAAMDAPSPVLGETLNADVTTVSDLIAVAAPAPVGQEPVTDLRRALCNNDRFLLARDLFDGDMKLCEQTIDRLNAFDDLDECMLYIAENFDWNPHCDGAKLLVDLIERKLV